MTSKVRLVQVEVGIEHKSYFVKKHLCSVTLFSPLFYRIAHEGPVAIRRSQQPSIAAMACGKVAPLLGQCDSNMCLPIEARDERIAEAHSAVLEFPIELIWVSQPTSWSGTAQI